MDDPRFHRGGKSFRLLTPVAGYTVSISMHAQPADLKRDMNAHFRERFPLIALTLSKLRSLKADMVAIGVACGYAPPLVATAQMYYECLVLKHKITKDNRKVVAGACITLAVKFFEVS